MGGACSSYGGGKACTGFRWGNLGKRDHWGDPGIDGRIIWRLIFRKWDVGGMDWIELAQDRDRCWALVNAVMNLRVPWNAKNFLTSRKPVSFSRRNLLHGVSKYLMLCKCLWVGPRWLRCYRIDFCLHCYGVKIPPPLPTPHSQTGRTYELL